MPTSSTMGYQSFRKMGCAHRRSSGQERRDEFVLQYLQKTDADHVAVILKAREPARILVAIGGDACVPTFLSLLEYA